MMVSEEIEQDAKWYTFPISGWFYRGKWSIWFKYDVSEVADLTTLGDTFRAEKINAPLSIYFWQTCHLINKTLRSVSYFCHNIVVGINVSDLKAMIRFQEQLANPSRLPTKLKSPRAIWQLLSPFIIIVAATNLSWMKFVALCSDCDSRRSRRCHKLDLLEEVPRIARIIAYNEEEVENKGKWWLYCCCLLPNMIIEDSGILLFCCCCWCCCEQMSGQKQRQI